MTRANRLGRASTRSHNLLETGDALLNHTGGGGYGDPFGVVLDPETFAVGTTATESLRGGPR